MKKEALMALLADLLDGSEIRIPPPVLARTFDNGNLTDLHWHDRLLNGLARLVPGAVTTALMLMLVGFTILAARWLASGGNFDQTSNRVVIADQLNHRPAQIGRLV